MTGGFSLVEMVVAVAVFIVAILIISGALLRLVDASRKAHSVRGAMDNVGTALEGMSRTMRFGTIYHCGCETTLADYATQRSCPLTDLATGAGGATCLAFEGQDGDPSNPIDQIVYRFQSVAGKGQVQRSQNSGTTWSAVTAPETIITSLTFYVNGTEADNNQPSANIVVRGYVQESPETRTTFDVQTIVTQRAPNFENGGFYQQPPTGCVSDGEDTIAKCSDGVDNNCNDLVDCADWTPGSCQEFDAPGQPCYEMCNDGIDNNGNGLTDCMDYSQCGEYGLSWDKANAANPKTNPAYPIPQYGCQEIRGSFSDGAPAFPIPGDPGNGCGDGVNNNGVSGIDCRDDYYCRDDISGKCIENCTDGVDNNGNGLIDCAEWAQCQAPEYPNCAVSNPPPTTPVCGDKLCTGDELTACPSDCTGSGAES